MDTTPLQRAVQVAGSQSALARLIGVRQGTLWKWLVTGRVPAEYAVPIEFAAGRLVTRYELRPDIFGSAPNRPAIPTLAPRQGKRAA